MHLGGMQRAGSKMRRYLNLGFVICALTAAFVFGHIIRPSTLSATLGLQPAGKSRAGSSSVLPATRAIGEVDPPLTADLALQIRKNFLASNPSLAEQDAASISRKSFEAYSRRITAFASLNFGETKPIAFFEGSHYSGWPGLCKATELVIPDPAWNTSTVSARSRYFVIGAFVSPVHAFNGSYDPSNAMARKQFQTYGDALKAWDARVEAICASRIPSNAWFTADGISAPEGAKLFDGVIAAARASDNPGFSVNCMTSPTNIPANCANASQVLAGLDPKNIARVESADDMAMAVDQKRPAAYRRVVIETHGNPYWRVEIRQEDPLVLGAKTQGYLVTWQTKSVEMVSAMQPLID